MQIRCTYCNNFIDDSDELCGFCGAPNDKLKRIASGLPATIDELISWCQEKNVPSKYETRFFIGENFNGENAYGIYYDKEYADFVIYQNDEFGKRTIVYRGDDEDYAVNEVFTKLRLKLIDDKEKAQLNRSVFDGIPLSQNLEYKPTNYNNDYTNKYSGTNYGNIDVFMDTPIPKTNNNVGMQQNTFTSNGYGVNNVVEKPKSKGVEIAIKCIIGVIIAIIVGFVATKIISHNIKVKNQVDGYYSFEDTYYYSLKQEWYEYNFKDDTWRKVEFDSKNLLEKSPKEYYVGQYCNDDDIETIFEATKIYEKHLK